MPFSSDVSFHSVNFFFSLSSYYYIVSFLLHVLFSFLSSSHQSDVFSCTSNDSQTANTAISINSTSRHTENRKKSEIPYQSPLMTTKETLLRTLRVAFFLSKWQIYCENHIKSEKFFNNFSLCQSLD